MKYCPTCQTEYDEEILRFCTKDGTPLIDESQPNFTELPSVSAEEEDDFGAETIIRKEKPLNPPPMDIVEDTAVEAKKEPDAPRLVIPTQEPQIRAKDTAYRTIEPPPRTNTALVVVTTILLTLVIIGGIVALFWAMGGKDNSANTNVNTNPPENLNVNVNSPVSIPASNFDYNTNTNYNFNSNIITNINTNLKTPTPTKTPSPSPSPSATPGANANTNANVAGGTPTPTVSRTPTPAPTPRPVNSPPVSRNTNTGV